MNELPFPKARITVTGLGLFAIGAGFGALLTDPGTLGWRKDLALVVIAVGAWSMVRGLVLLLSAREQLLIAMKELPSSGAGAPAA